jgi:hypothetical protein
MLPAKKFAHVASGFVVGQQDLMLYNLVAVARRENALSVGRPAGQF